MHIQVDVVTEMRLIVLLVFSTTSAVWPEEESLAVCQDFYASLVNPPPLETVYNSFLAEGGQSYIYRCGTSHNSTVPHITANKYFKSVLDKNLTEIEIINRASAAAGIRAEVYYFHENGFIEEFLSGKQNLWQSEANSGLTVRDREIWSNAAKLIAQMHSLELPNIDKDKYKRPTEGWWNTRLIKEHFTDMFWFTHDGFFDRTMKVRY